MNNIQNPGFSHLVGNFKLELLEGITNNVLETKLNVPLSTPLTIKPAFINIYFDPEN